MTFLRSTWARLCVLILAATLPAPALSGLTVQTTTGIFTGLQSPLNPRVREFRNIPYAQAPVGDLRWLPPLSPPASKRHRFSTRFPPSCPQYLPRTLSVWNTNISDFMVSTYGQSKTSGFVAQSTSEDCLSLAIWTPLDVQEGAKLPVAFFMTGGSFQIGGIDVPYQMPPAWVQRSQQHIVVTINYRVNIFGFPNAAALENQNLGILDQRMALEWVYGNIEKFGGDRNRITMWGQSAGGVSADIHNYAFHADPIVSGLFMQSGSAFSNFKRRDFAHLNFTFVANRLGCMFPYNPQAELDCMRTVPYTQIINFIGNYVDNRTRPALEFRPVPDGRIVFNNYTERGEKGLISKLPALVSLTSNEDSSMISYPSDLTSGPNKTEMDKGTIDLFVCVASNTTAVRSRNKLLTYRYQYAGNFSNLTPLPWLGAYHSADVPMLFGTYERPDSAAEAFQREVAETMQDYVLTFMQDPVNGLRDKGWEPDGPHDSEERHQFRFGTGGKVAQSVNSWEIDGACLRGLPYNGSP